MKKITLNVALLDSLFLALLIVTMCSQLNLGDIGQDTTAQGYVTKQLKIALPDIMLFAVFAWFVVTTTLKRAWKKLWWPPFACWALLFALLVAMLHSRPLTRAVSENLVDVEGISATIKALITKESKDAIADTIQFAGYFLIAPFLFVNLIHDRRGAALLSRRRLALTTFLWAVIASLGYALLNPGASGYQGFFGSPNALSGFLAIAIALLASQLLWIENRWRKIHWMVALTALAALCVVSSLWAFLAILIGLALASSLTIHRERAKIVMGSFAAAAIVLWLLVPAPPVIVPAAQRGGAPTTEPPLRFQSARLASATEAVKKQYVEWYVATVRLADRREAGFATGAAPGNYQFNIGAYYVRLPNEEKMSPDSNNLYLVQAVNIGVLGLGTLLWVVLHFAQIAWRARFQFPNDWLAGGVLCAIGVWLFINLFHALIVRGTGIVFAFILSLAVIAFEADWDKRNRSGNGGNGKGNGSDNLDDRNFSDMALS